MGMTEKPHAAVRLTDRFFFYDPDHGAFVSSTFAKGAIVIDPVTIRFLVEHGAPIEPIAPTTTQRRHYQNE
jgi:hypothetical protein